MLAPDAPAPIRRIRFDYPADTKPVWTPNRPEFSCAANSISLLMPSIEPYFVRSVRSAIPELPAERASVCQAYVAQEAQHHRQHVRFNKILIEAYPALATVDSLADRCYRGVESRRSAQFSRAFAAGSETIAYSAARWAAANRVELFGSADEVPASLFLWHLAEEVEHKSVAHDVYWELYRTRRLARTRLAAATVVSLLMLVVFVAMGTTAMLWAERRLHRPMSWFHLTRWGIGFAFELLSNLAMSLLPSHHPNDFTDPTWYEVWLQEYDAEDGTLPIWTQAAKHS
ncbi:MAG: metal-dependent hydrolase [Acidimicrobiales bacterium]